MGTEIFLRDPNQPEDASRNAEEALSKERLSRKRRQIDADIRAWFGLEQPVAPPPRELSTPEQWTQERLEKLDFMAKLFPGLAIDKLPSEMDEVALDNFSRATQEFNAARVRSMSPNDLKLYEARAASARAQQQRDLVPPLPMGGKHPRDMTAGELQDYERRLKASYYNR